MSDPGHTPSSLAASSSPTPLPPVDVREARHAAEAYRDPRGRVWLLRPRPSGARFEKAEHDAARAMLDHGLTEWAFGFGRGKRTLGTTRVRVGATTGVIRLSRHLIDHASSERRLDTLLHEIAHAVAYQRHGRVAMNHGPLWRRVAREVGAEPRATCRDGPDLPAKHTLVCMRCGTRVGLHRRPKHPGHAYRHRGCGGRFQLEAAGRDSPARR